MKISLMVLSAGKAAGKALPITGSQFIIGRDPQCNLRPASAMISKRHCALLVKSGQVFLRDFESTNGTFVNDEQIKGEVPLKDGDVLRLGPLSFKVVIEGVVATKPTPPPKPKGADLSEEDAAAAMLSMDEETGEVSVSTTETSEDHQIPGGTTVMDMPAFVPEGAPPKEEEAAKKEEKPEDKKAKNAKTGAAQDAAKAILEKMRQGRRK
ncbi:MAG TPA: FHA domain-containing protein [Gemmataceae bacterium]|nr:FHA domain-containing protein [Gemmataceae bacterium]